MERQNIGIFGSDRRQSYIAQGLVRQGYAVYTYQLTEHTAGATECRCPAELASQCEVLVGPIPFCGSATEAAAAAEIATLLKSGQLFFGGKIPAYFTERCQRQDIPCVDLLQNERVAILNAVATAEGAIVHAIADSVINLQGSHCLMLGYGRCGRVLAHKLKALDALVTVAARSQEARAYAEATGMRFLSLPELENKLSGFDFIFNTIPSLILDAQRLSRLDPEAIIIDLASSPGGVDYAAAERLGIRARLCPGLPGKVAPKSSADILVSELVTLLKGDVMK